MKRSALMFLCILMPGILSCSGFSIKKDISEKSRLSTLKRSGMVVRMWKSSMVESGELGKSITYWLEGSGKKKELLPLSGIKEGLYIYDTPLDRFYQLAEDNSFLTYKSIGVVRDYINRNREELKKIMAENTLDSLIIYEVDGYFSPELQYIDLNSMAVILDSEMNLVYMDHQSQGFDIDEWDREMVKKILLDKISQRLLHSLESLDYIEKK